MLLKQVLKTIRHRELFQPGELVLVAVSGGPDSMALAHVLAALRSSLGHSLEIASVDHGLRSDARDEVALVERFARSLNVPFHGLQVEVGPGASLQANARDLRYGALHQTAVSIGATALAVGHTRDDQAETVIHRLLRGTGFEGLRGIDPSRSDRVVRPLIDVTRDLVCDHVRRHAIEVVCDPSNVDRRFTRARIRHEILPLLKSENPEIVKHLANLAEEASTVASAFEPWVEEAIRAASDGDGLDRKALLATTLAVRSRALCRWVESRTDMALGRAHRTAIEQLLRGTGHVLLPRGYVVRVAGPKILVERSSSSKSRSSRP